MGLFHSLLQAGLSRRFRWSNHYKVAFNFSKAANWLDHKAFWIAAKAYESRRPGCMDLKAFVLFRDGNRCRQCGIRVTHETSHADHIKPVSSFASYKQATTLENLQTLCLECHKLKTYRS